MSSKTANLALPFLNGVYVAIDALSRAFLLVDGPYCVMTKAEMQYCHNLRCRLLPQVGHSRLLHTASDALREEVAGLATDRTAGVEQVFAQLCALPEAEIVLATSFDFHELLDFPLGDMTERFAGRCDKLVCHVPSRSLGGDWLDGYAGVCESLARRVPLDPAKRRASAVAIVGYLFDRDEPDHHANLDELRRLCASLGAEVASVWLSGGGLAELSAVESASLVVSLPYARSAARILAERLGAELLEVELPLGLAGTERFVRAIAERLGCAERAEKMLDDELASALRDTERHVLRVVRGHPALLEMNDPHLDAALAELCRTIGLDLCEGGANGVDRSLTLSLGPTMTRRSAHLFLPIGYPNYLHHPVTPSPFLGFAGYRHLVDRIARAILESATSPERE